MLQCQDPSSPSGRRSGPRRRYFIRALSFSVRSTAGSAHTTALRTTIIVHIVDAILCRLFAHNNGYHKNFWTMLGLIFGIWAVAVLLVLPKREVPGSA